MLYEKMFWHFLETPKTIMKNLSHDSLSPDQGLKLGPLKYEARELPLNHSIQSKLYCKLFR
jgi:hypothetical protein